MTDSKAYLPHAHVHVALRRQKGLWRRPKRVLVSYVPGKGGGGEEVPQIESMSAGNMQNCQSDSHFCTTVYIVFGNLHTRKKKHQYGEEGDDSDAILPTKQCLTCTAGGGVAGVDAVNV
jgi:hypothetical protein